jgi:hypothetical protein
MNEISKIEQVVINGDLSALDPLERVVYYKDVCNSIGLNPLTMPFRYFVQKGKLTLYASKDATDQLRTLHKISIKITCREKIGDVYVVTAQGINKEGRVDESTGAVDVKGLGGENLANAFMKAETKAKRRVTLSLAGLGFSDESEISSIPNSKFVDVDMETGEIMQSLPEPKKNLPKPTPEQSHLVKGLLVDMDNDDKMSASQKWQGMPLDIQKSVWEQLTNPQKAWLDTVRKNPPRFPERGVENAYV